MVSPEREPPDTPAKFRDVRYEHSKELAPFLRTLGVSVLLSTYQAGKVVVLGQRLDTLHLSFHNFDRPMGMAVDAPRDRVAVAARDKIWFLRNERQVAEQLDRGGYDSCFLTRTAHVTGDIQAHEIAWAADELWIVNTLFSCLCTLDARHSFVPRWRPPFISQLSAEDRCHLNGLAMRNGRPKYVTALGETDSPGGWRTNKATAGCLVDVDSGATIARGFAMPHSPVCFEDHVLLLDSGWGALVRVGAEDGHVQQLARFPGYTRGLAVYQRYAFLGLSRIRETSTFGELPVADRREELKCGMAIVNLETGTLEGQFEFLAGVEEIFDITVVPDARGTALRGPHATEDGHGTIWIVPPEAADPTEP